MYFTKQPQIVCCAALSDNFLWLESLFVSHLMGEYGPITGSDQIIYTMKTFIEYKSTKGGKLVLLGASEDGADEQQADERDLLGVSALQPGLYEIKGLGALPEVGQGLLVPVKGSRQLSLRFVISQVDTLIQPANAWTAQCEGPDIMSFNLREAKVTCDHCFKEYSVEFIEHTGDLSADAIESMNGQGWMASTEAQVCPSCQTQNNNH